MKYWRILLFSLLYLSPLVLSACNTVEGAGKDIERGGEKIQGAAEGADRS